MSVINRMLQDIDRRNAALNTAADEYPEPRMVAPRKDGRSVPGYLWLAGVVVGLLAIGLIVWRQWHDQPSPHPALSQPTMPMVAPAVTALPAPTGTLIEPPVGLPALAENLAIVSSTPLAEPVRAVPLIASDALKLSMKLFALAADAPPNNASPKSIVTTAPTKLVSQPSAVPELPGKTTISNLPVRQVAADETIAAARMMWNDGEHSAAMTTLREALAAAENTRSQRAIGLLGREIARLEVVDNRPQVAIDLLKRLENIIGSDADAWALRGNAEQRLALHQDAVASYLAALKIRPNEGKWMLGAAISLAVSGKLDEAQVWVDRAKERDAITPTIGAYLKQLGIKVVR